MNYEIITDRFEIEKMAEDMFLSDDEILVHIDYADLRTLKRHAHLSTPLYVISNWEIRRGQMN